MKKYDFSGWATKANVQCADRRTIMKDAFKHNDGQTVPLVWNHQHDNPFNVLGHALLENRAEGVYAYCTFNDTEQGRNAKGLVQNGDVKSLSIYANQLTQDRGNVIHGTIREVSLVLAGANPEAYIDAIYHSEDGEIKFFDYEESIFCSHEDIVLHSADEDSVQEGEKETMADEQKEKTVQDVFDELTEEQKTVVYALIGQALEDAENDEEDEDEGEDENMKHNVFENDTQNEGVLIHAAQENIISMAKASNIGSLQAAISIYAEENNLQHGFVDDKGADATDWLFPDFKDVKPGAPELIERDQTWVGEVMRKTHKSPISRIRTMQADARGTDVRAHGYQNKGSEKTLSGNIKLMQRTTDPQTVYRKEMLHRDDIIDITDFDVVEYQYGIMKRNLNEDIALATMIGDGRDDGDPDKIHETHIRSIWNDDELYTIHYDVDLEAAKKELQGSNTDANFGENYIYAEALVTAALYSREQYRGSGNLEFYCTPHLLNVMLLARDLNGRRIYDSKADLAKALNVSAIHEAEQFEGRVRTTEAGAKKKLLGIFVNLADYQHGSTKGGEITRFEQFDIDFNQNKYLIETRLSGALTRIKSAIALEEPVAAE